MRHTYRCYLATAVLKQPKQTCDTSAAALKQPISSSSRSRYVAHRPLSSSNRFPQAAEADMRHIGRCSVATDFLKQRKQTCGTSAAALKQLVSSRSRSRPATHRPLISSNGFPQAAEADMRHIGRCSLAAAFLKQPKQTCDTAAATLSQRLSLDSRSRHATHRPLL